MRDLSEVAPGCISGRVTGSLFVWDGDPNAFVAGSSSSSLHTAREHGTHRPETAWTVPASLEESRAWGPEGDGWDGACYWGCWCGGVCGWSEDKDSPAGSPAQTLAPPQLRVPQITGPPSPTQLRLLQSGFTASILTLKGSSSRPPSARPHLGGEMSQKSN